MGQGMTRVYADWDEAYPALFLVVEGDINSDPSDRKMLAERGMDVPTELAMRWKVTRDAWYALGKEIADYQQGRSA
jgi:hypothetical protein